MRKLTTLLLVIAFGILFSGGGAQAMSIFGSEFQSKHKELFQDVEKLNAYTRTHKVELSGVTVKEVKLSKAEFHGASFKNVKWEDDFMEDSIFINVVFVECEFINSNFNAGNFVDCEFVNCKFDYTKMNRAIFKNGKFQSCEIKNSGMVKWTGDEVVFNKGTLLDTPLAQGNITFTFRDTDLDGVRVMMTEGARPLLIEGGTLSEVDFGKSHFSTVTLRRVKQGEGPVKLNDITAEKVVFDHVNLTKGTAIARSEVKSVSIEGGDVGTSFGKSTIGSVYIRDANLYYMEFSRVSLPKVTIANCKLYDTGFYDGYIDELTVQNSEFDIIAGKNFKADTVVWHNVTLDGKIDFTNAQIKDFRPTDIKRGPNLQLITTGSNIRF